MKQKKNVRKKKSKLEDSQRRCWGASDSLRTGFALDPWPKMIHPHTLGAREKGLLSLEHVFLTHLVNVEPRLSARRAVEHRVKAREIERGLATGPHGHGAVEEDMVP